MLLVGGCTISPVPTPGDQGGGPGGPMATEGGDSTVRDPGDAAPLGPDAGPPGDDGAGQANSGDAPPWADTDERTDAPSEAPPDAGGGDGNGDGEGFDVEAEFAIPSDLSALSCDELKQLAEDAIALGPGCSSDSECCAAGVSANGSCSVWEGLLGGTGIPVHVSLAEDVGRLAAEFAKRCSLSADSVFHMDVVPGASCWQGRCRDAASWFDCEWRGDVIERTDAGAARPD